VEKTGTLTTDALVRVSALLTQEVIVEEPQGRVQMTALTSTPNRYLRWLSCTAGFAPIVFQAPISFTLEWHIERVDDFGIHTSLALDASSYPHVSYYDYAYRDLKYAYRDGSGWHIETVDAVGWVGRHTSLALDGSGYPHISYYDETNDALNYAYALGPTPIVLTASKADGQLVLNWTAVTGAAAYWINGMTNEPWFLPDLSPPTYVNRLTIVPEGTTMWSSPNGIGDPVDNWTYLVVAIEGVNSELARSNRVGEYDFDTDVP
jgi:hypothetical protein